MTRPAVHRLSAYGVLAFAMAGLVLVLLTGCATNGRLDMCKYADVRRATYTTAITAADAYVASGRPVPSELLLGRQAAAVALTVLNARCPVAE